MFSIEASVFLNLSCTSALTDLGYQIDAAPRLAVSMTCRTMCYRVNEKTEPHFLQDMAKSKTHRKDKEVHAGDVSDHQLISR
jgi:hypothetical protein